MAPNRSSTHTNFIGPIKKELQTFTESAAVDVILGYLRKYHLAEIDAISPQSIFQFPLSWNEKTFWSNDYSQEYTEDVIHDIYADEPTKFFDFVRTAIRLIKKEKGNDSPEWDYLRIRLVEDAQMAFHYGCCADGSAWRSFLYRLLCRPAKGPGSVSVKRTSTSRGPAASVGFGCVPPA